MKTLYDQLSVTVQASPKAIQQAFFRLAKKFDPKNPANHGIADAGTHYRTVHEAYRILMALKMDEVRVEHVQAVARYKDEQPKAVVIDTPHSRPAVVSAANDAQKR